MKKYLAASFLFLVLCPLGFAQTDFIAPKQRITGAEEPIPLGELVYLGVSKIEDKPKYLQSVKYSWKLYENGKERTQGVRFGEDNVFFGAGVRSKRLVVIVSAVYLYVIRDGEKQDGVVKEVGVRQNFLSAEVVIGDGPPGPLPPDPNPPIPPKPPDFPDEVSRLAWTWAQTVNLTASDRSQVCRALANSFRSVANRIKNGQLTDVKQILLESRTENNKALGNHADAFDNTFGKSLQDFLYSKYKDGSLRVAEDYRKVWESIAVGLDKV